jgi:hypothetical protein
MEDISLQAVEQLALQLSPDDQLTLVEDVARNLRVAQRQRPPQDLYGLWRERFPSDFDLDAIICGARSAWQNEIQP